MQKKKNLIIGIVLGVVAVSAVVAKILLCLNKFRKNTDFFFFMDQDELNFDGDVFEDTNIAGVMSSVVVDLSNAEASENPMNLVVKGKSSSIDVIVPKDWNVKVQGDNNKSTIENATTFDKDDFTNPLLFVNYQLSHSVMNIYHGYLAPISEPAEEAIQ